MFFNNYSIICTVEKYSTLFIHFFFSRRLAKRHRNKDKEPKSLLSKSVVCRKDRKVNRLLKGHS